MAIRRAKRKSRFSQVPVWSLQDARLTFEARGVLCLLLSKPEDWIIHKSWILTQSPKCGRDKMNRIFKELQYFGYLEKDFDRSNNGQFNGVDWLLHDTPYLKVEQPQSEKPQPEKPDSGKSASTNTDLTNTDNTNTSVNGSTTVGVSGEGSLPFLAKASGKVEVSAGIQRGWGNSSTNSESNTNSTNRGYSTSGLSQEGRSFGSVQNDSRSHSLSGSYVLSNSTDIPDSG